jgi:predicted phosphodiesterase
MANVTGEYNRGKADIAREFRSKYPDFSNSHLARVIYNENKLLFESVDDARFFVRYIEGKTGKKLREDVKKTEHFKPEKVRSSNPYDLPDSDETVYEPYILEAKKILCLSDIHIPYHSVEALTAALDFGSEENPDCILLNGDILDFFGLSKFVKDPSKRRFSEELNMFGQFFSVLQKEFPTAKKIFKIGNHEERYQVFLWQHAKELSDVPEFSLENIIKARADGIEVVKDKRIINFYGLNIIHGHEFSTGFFSPVNIARGLFLRAKTSAIQGHNHQTSEHTESDMNGKITTTWSQGCLCELHPSYAPINKWNWGFSIIDNVDGGFEVKNKRIFKGRVL